MNRLGRWWHDRHCRDTSPEHRHAVHGVMYRTSTGEPYYGRHFAYQWAYSIGKDYQPRHAEVPE